MQTNSFAKAQDPRGRDSDPEPSSRPYNDPALSPTEFLKAVMHEDTISIALRVKAAKALTDIQSKAPPPSITLHIRDPYSHEFVARFLKTTEQINGKSQSKSDFANDNHHPSSKTPPPSNTETNSYPPTLPDYSSPPTPEEIQQIKAAVHALQPDFDPSQPVPLYLCACGHWLTFQCDCVTGTRH
jgi:hypothetical protein